MEILDGLNTKIQLLENLKKKVLKLERPLGLVVIQIGLDKASTVYVNQKRKMAESLGFNFNHIKLDDNVDEDTVIKLIQELNNDNYVDGILVQMPLPSHLNEKRIQNAVDPNKDVDGLTDINAGRLSHGIDSLIPCTPAGIMDLLKIYKIGVEGKNVTIVGRSDLVGKPLSYLMTNNNATVTLCHSKTNNLKLFTRLADILVVAIGKPEFIKEDYVKNGSVVIDVGINRVDGKLIGDVDFSNVSNKCSYITKVPGGVGPMTVYELANNTYKAYTLRKNKFR